MPGSLHIIDGATVKHCLPMAECIDAMAETQVAIYKGDTTIPQRLIFALPAEGRFFGAMPGAMTTPAVCGAKLMTLYETNPSHGLPALQGVVVLFDLERGKPLAMIDAAAVTAIRTAAASAAATRVLARGDARALAIFGHGVQAATHLEAMLAVRSIDHVWVWGRSAEKAREFAEQMSARFDIAVETARDARAAAEQADILCTVTGASEPVVEGSWIKPGAHLNLVGAHSATTREVDAETIKRARLIVESKASALHEAGDILIPMKAGEVDEDCIAAEIAEVILGEVVGRDNDSQITVYKALGNAAQDLAAAHMVLERARSAGRGVSVPFN
jgi:ornithine cyclodeaminase